jgi:hypothetical protein
VASGRIDKIGMMSEANRRVYMHRHVDGESDSYIWFKGCAFDMIDKCSSARIDLECEDDSIIAETERGILLKALRTHKNLKELK